MDEIKLSKNVLNNSKDVNAYFSEKSLQIKDKSKDIKKLFIMDNVLLEVFPLNNMKITVQEVNNKSAILVNQIIRTIIKKNLFESWYGILHSAWFELNNKWYLVLGDKADGKTTTLSQALYKKNASFVSNDRIFYKLLPEGLHVINREQHIRVWERTAQDIPALWNFVTENSPPKDKADKYYINNLDKLIGNNPKNETFVNSIVLPNFSKNNLFFDETPINMINQSIINDAQGLQLYKILFGNYLPIKIPDNKNIEINIYKWNWVATLEDLISSL